MSNSHIGYKGQKYAVVCVWDGRPTIYGFTNDHDGGKLAQSARLHPAVTSVNTTPMQKAGPPDGVDLIADERIRQITKEGWTPDHDDKHRDGAMAITAACYAANETHAKVVIDGEDAFPWGSCADKRKKHDRIRQLTIAGALIAAEIDRLQRAEK